MENFPLDSGMRDLVKELTEGGEVAQQLKNHLNEESYSAETLENLLHKILNSYDRSLSILNHNQSHYSLGSGGLTSPKSLNESLLSDDFDDPDSKKQGYKDQNSAKTGKKDVPKWMQKIKVCPEKGAEGQLDDGFFWRKYGQKYIQGTKHPRSYYRCTHRNSKGCLARKQVQKSDDDPNIFEIKYKGLHTCKNHPSISITDPKMELETISPQENSSKSQNQQEPFFNIQTSLKVKTQDLDKDEDPFNLPSSASMNSEISPNFPDWNPNSSDLASPGIAGSSYFNDCGGFMDNLQDSESEFSRVALDTDFPLSDLWEFDSNFGFGNSKSFP